MLGVEVGCVVADRDVARQRSMVRMRAMRAHSRRRLPKIRPKASSSTRQHGRNRTNTPGERTHLEETRRREGGRGRDRQKGRKLQLHKLYKI